MKPSRAKWSKVMNNWAFTWRNKYTWGGDCKHTDPHTFLRCLLKWVVYSNSSNIIMFCGSQYPLPQSIKKISFKSKQKKGISTWVILIGHFEIFHIAAAKKPIHQIHTTRYCQFIVYSLTQKKAVKMCSSDAPVCFFNCRIWNPSRCKLTNI